MGGQAIDTMNWPPAWRAVLAHPAFDNAGRQLVGNMLLACEEDERMGAVCKDAGRYLCAMYAMHLDPRGGITQSALKAICAASGFLSAGRARSLLAFLQHLDFLRAATPGARPMRYHPTPRFLAAWRRHLELALRAATLLAPELDGLATQLTDDTLFRRFLDVQITRLHQAALGPDPAPFVRGLFLHPYAGTQLLWALSGHGQGDAPFPPREPVPIVLSHLAKRFGVTHVHLRGLLRQAHAQGMMVRIDRGRVEWSAPGRAMVRAHFAAQLAELIDAGRAVLPPAPGTTTASHLLEPTG